MKNHLKIILLCTITFLIAICLWLCNREKGSRTNLAAERSVTNDLIPQNVAQSVISKQQTNTSVSTTAIAIPKTLQTNSIAPEEKLRALIENKNTAINFWGIVVDQDGTPLEGVKIAGDTRTWHMTVAQNFDASFPTFNAVSDSNGKFEIHEASGDVLTIKSLDKEGCEPEPHALRGFGYHTSERFSSDPSSPVIFKMWKTNIHEQLIIGKKRFHVVPDGRSYVIDLNQGTISESGSGDLKVWINYTNQVIRGQPYDWSCEITPTTGGLLEETDPYSSMFLAPIDGYVPTFQLQQQIKGGQYGSIGDKRFYVMLKNGKEYGRITIDLIAPYNDQIPGMIDIQYAINPSGSRILKP